MKKRKEQKLQSYEAIKITAARLLKEHGFAGFSVQRVMSEVGLTVGAFYAHYKSKDALLSAALDVAMDEITELIQQNSQSPSHEQPVCVLANNYLSEMHRDNVQHGCPLPAILGEAAATSESTQYQELLGNALLGMQKNIDSVVGDGPFSRDTLALISLLVGGQILARATRGTNLSSDVLASCRDFISDYSKNEPLSKKASK